jgi:transcription-repair coupling factor (superfamily II helicase)
VQSLARRLENGGVFSCAGISEVARPFVAALIARLFPLRPIVVVTDLLKTQESFQQDLETWAGLESAPGSPPSFQPLFYPAWEVLPNENKLPHPDNITDRLQTLVALADSSEDSNSKSQIVVATVTALLQRTFTRAELKTRMRMLARGERIDPLDLVEWLEEQGYEPEAQVTQKGELALRGGILDVFPLTSPWPVRLEFFGDELESLRYFDPQTQISREEITAVTLPPAGELGVLKSELERGPAPARSRAPFATLLDFLPNNTIFILCEPESLASHADEYAQQLSSEDPFFISWQNFREIAVAQGKTFLELSEAAGEGTESDCLDLEFASLDAYRPVAERALDPQIAEVQRREFFAQLHRWVRQDYSVHVFCNNDGEQQRFLEIWNELLGLPNENPPTPARWIEPQGDGSSEDVPEDHPLPQGEGRGEGEGNSKRVDQAVSQYPHPTIHIGSLARGFISDEAKLVVVTDAEIFGRYKIQRPRRLKSPHALATRSALDIDFTELEEGDLVVHLQHGIGKYLGLKNLPVTASSHHAPRNPQHATECLVIEYAPTDSSQEPPKLYVPVTESHLVSKYVGAGKIRPPLNTLGGTRWQKAKEHAERAVRDVASELLSIQAARASQEGHPFKADTPWQREFEGAFIFEETPDQLRAIEETKTDMERPKPMDRLICGDVGFGKTEVAIRAAFKAVMDGRQVAVLVPTTVLAQQHFNTFRERMADYPVRIELLSRFRTRRQQTRTITDLAAGAVDIVIGTHRLIQSDVEFKDLGLVVIDEEQRFGVLHKEKFKMLRKLVDVLTLSATPIPRTLYLALTGARDMSSIQTPPHDRLPVETVVTQYDERIIRDAILRELHRGGQVFFLHNRVMTIHAMEQKLRTLVPQARIVVGHGQMHADDLEEVMTTFVNGEADILLSTTIIESGLDIPNANTIIIDRADRFGLSDLYQLRGRVGRYKHQAYAYLLLPRHARLPTDVRKRISAIKQYSTLGSGFKIAMRDLEIRGAGNLLGSEQSGHITAVGFELYCQLLKQSVASLKGEKVKPRVEVQVRLDFLGDAAALPENYATEPQHRIEIYRKIAQATEKSALETLQKELRDRFGPLPPSAELLLLVSELKILASERGITVMEVKEEKLMLTRQGDFITVGGKFPRLTKKDAKGRLKEIKKLLLAL